MSDDLSTIEAHSGQPPFEATLCARSLGLEVEQGPIAAAVECRFTRRGPNHIVISAALADMAPRKTRFAVAIAIAHFVLHRDLMWDKPHGDAVFADFVDTGTPLREVYETQARRQALEFMAPLPAVGHLIRDQLDTEAAARMVADHFDLPISAARLYVDQANRRPQRRLGVNIFT